MKTTFSLLPEDNPFQDITIGSLLGWGSYGRVHRGMHLFFHMGVPCARHVVCAQAHLLVCHVRSLLAYACVSCQHDSCFILHLPVFPHAGYWNGSLVAVKVLEQVAGDFNPRSSLEPLLHHRLSHPNIVAMFDVCTQVKQLQIESHKQHLVKQ